LKATNKGKQLSSIHLLSATPETDGFAVDDTNKKKATPSPLQYGDVVLLFQFYLWESELVFLARFIVTQ
jgi:hypothetical protein